MGEVTGSVTSRRRVWVYCPICGRTSLSEPVPDIYPGTGDVAEQQPHLFCGEGDEGHG